MNVASAKPRRFALGSRGGTPPARAPQQARPAPPVTRYMRSIRQELRRIATFIAEMRREEREFGALLRGR